MFTLQQTGTPNPAPYDASSSMITFSGFQVVADEMFPDRPKQPSLTDRLASLCAMMRHFKL